MKTIVETDSDFICDLNAPCFQSLTVDEMELVQASKAQVQFRKGDNLTKQGAFASYLMFIVKGLAIQYIENGDTKSFNLRIIQPGEFIGLSSIFSSNTFNYSSVALTDCQVFLVDKAAVVRIMNENGKFALGLIRRYSEQNVNLFDTLRTVMYKQMNGRLADTLLYIEGLKTVAPDMFQLLARKDIADFAGISTESAVKLLKTFEKEGIIVLNGKDIEILNAESLKEISKRG
jgi:CRP/FNR family transcriptional regulator